MVDIFLRLVALLLFVVRNDARLVTGRLTGIGTLSNRHIRPTSPPTEPHFQPLSFTHSSQQENDPIFKHSYDYSDEDGRKVRFAYDVEHRPDVAVYALDLTKEVMHIAIKHDPYTEVFKTADLVLESPESAISWKQALSSEDEDAFLTGGTHWGYTDRSTDNPQTIFFRVTKVALSSQHLDTLTLELEEAHFVDIFKNADAKLTLLHARDDLEHPAYDTDFSFNLEEEHADMPSSIQTKPHAGTRHLLKEERDKVDTRLSGDGENADVQSRGGSSRVLLGSGGSGSSVFDIVKEIKGFIKKGLQVVRTAGDVTKRMLQFAEFAFDTIVDGNSEYRDGVAMDLVSVNYDKETDSSICEISFDFVLNRSQSLEGLGEVSGEVGLSGTCHDCYAHTEISTNVHLKIQDYSVERAAVWAEGAMHFKYNFSMEIKGEGKYSNNRLIYKYKIPQRLVTIAAVPFLISGDVPIYLGAEGTATGAVQIEGTFLLTAVVKLGFEYVKNAGVQMIDKIDITREGNGIAPKEIQGSVGLRLFLWPAVQLNVNKMGGPTFSLKTYLEGIVDASTPLAGNANGKKCYTDIQFNAAIGVVGALGAKVKIKFASRKVVDEVVDPKTLITLKYAIYSKKWVNKHACASNGSSRRRSLMNELPTSNKPVSDSSEGFRRRLLGLLPEKFDGAPCSGLSQSACMRTDACGWCVMHTYCSVPLTISSFDGLSRGRCDGGEKRAWGETFGKLEYRPFDTDRGSGTKEYHYEGECIKDVLDGKQPIMCDAGGPSWISAKVSKKQEEIGSSWAKLGTLVSGMMVKTKPNDVACAAYPEFMNVFGQVLTSADSQGDAEIAFAFSAGADNIAKDNANESYAAVTQVRYIGTAYNSAGINFRLNQETIRRSDSSDPYDIFYQESSRAKKYEIPNSYGVVYKGDDDKLKIDLYDTLLCTRTELSESSASLAELTSINTGIEGGDMMQDGPSPTWDGLRRRTLLATSPPPSPPPRALASAPPNKADGSNCPWAQVTSEGKTCCRVCKKGKACGNTCINQKKECSTSEGCACNKSDLKTTKFYGGLEGNEKPTGLYQDGTSTMSSESDRGGHPGMMMVQTIGLAAALYLII